MSSLSGFKYREITKKLKKLGFALDRQAAGSHEVWYNPNKNLYTTIPKHTGDMLAYLKYHTLYHHPQLAILALYYWFQCRI